MHKFPPSVLGYLYIAYFKSLQIFRINEMYDSYLLLQGLSRKSPAIINIKGMERNLEWNGMEVM